ncbi:MAG: uracil-DNA glycosylase [Chloroflexi bacterium]|nr:uracil-DNA glycosylase [Chloroflexota bacterium]
MSTSTETTEKIEALKELRRRMVEGRLLPPCEAPERLVFGEGSPNSRLAIVGEAPGEQEERQGRPFVGQAGQLLRRTLEEVGIDPDAVWITNVVKCRPVSEAGGRRRINRAPARREGALWEPWLMEELRTLQPVAIVCLGNIAANSLIQKDFRMNRDRGKWFPSAIGVPALATFHPAYVLRQRHPQAQTVRQLFKDDLAEAKRKIEQANGPARRAISYHRGR